MKELSKAKKVDEGCPMLTNIIGVKQENPIHRQTCQGLNTPVSNRSNDWEFARVKVVNTY